MQPDRMSVSREGDHDPIPFDIHDLSAEIALARKAIFELFGNRDQTMPSVRQFDATAREENAEAV